ncbi:MAG: fibronectin type III domain-containing protein [Treponema sp.]|jgi:hypothetical protein|nr:fibronectin type III domain-containing protein [Treponema sp.]
MKKSACFHLFFFIFASLSGPLRGLGEKTLVIGGASGWRAAEKRDGLVEISSVRPHPVLALSSASGIGQAGLSVPDMLLSFDEGSPGRFGDRTGRYRVSISNGVQAADGTRARMGTGAALFQTGAGAAASSEPILVEPSNGEALFAPGRRIGDFSLEFWLYPLHMEDGEQILTWTASGKGWHPGRSETETGFQRILCAAVKNRLQWTFADFFISPGGTDHIDLSLSGNAPVVPGVWSHHLVRFESDTGLLEYLVNGRSEAIVYASPSGREGGEVYTPLTGAGGSFSAGNRFSGLLDELALRGSPEKPGLQKYRRSGRFETGPVDLGQGGGGMIRVEASGGRTRVEGGVRRNTYGGGFNYPDNAAVRFYIRTAGNPYDWTEADWQPFFPGTDLSEIRSRYVQFAADFYPSGDGETSPYLEELRIVYLPDDPPRPPMSVTAVTRDGAVELSWKPSPDQDTAGYLVYYGTSRGEYFGEDAILGTSPVDAGKNTGLRIEGLTNGVLYYFAVAAYDRGGVPGSSFHAGEFSREVGVRPVPEPIIRPVSESRTGR